MPIEVTSLNSLDPDEVQSREEFIIELIKELYPDLDLQRGGILEQLLAYPNSLLDVMNQEELDRLRQSTSLLAVAENPELADPEILDKLLSNYLIERTDGTAAAGEITVTISSLTSIVIPASTTFTVNGRTFAPTTEIIAVTTRDLITATNTVLLQSTGEGTYWFPVPVVEDTLGGEAVLAGTTFEVTPAITDFVSAYASLDLDAGTPAGSNAEAYQELEEGISAKALADRVSISSLLKKEFTQLIDLKTIGYGDAEMHRDAHNIFGISSGGKADLYLRTSQSLAMRTFTFLVSPVSAGNLGTLPVYGGEYLIPPTLLPAFYRLEYMSRVPDVSTEVRLPGGFIPPGSGMSWEEVGDRGIYVPAGEENMPALFTAAEARFTKYQGSARIHVTDQLSQANYRELYRSRLVDALPITAYVGLPGQGSGLAQYIVTISTESALDWYLQSSGMRLYNVYLSYMPDITDVQDYVNEYDRQAPTSADYLARAVIPCVVSVSVNVAIRRGLTPPSTEALKRAIATAINGTRLGATEMPATTVINAIDAVVGTENGYAMTPVSLTGSLLMPDGSTVTLTSSSSLVIPDYSSSSVTNRTTAFLTYSNYINVGLTTVD